MTSNAPAIPSCQSRTAPAPGSRSAASGLSMTRAPLTPGGGVQHRAGFARVLLLAGDRLHPQLDQGGVAGNRLRHGPAPRRAVVAQGQETPAIVGETGRW